jgi:hypothetical protein
MQTTLLHEDHSTQLVPGNVRETERRQREDREKTGRRQGEDREKTGRQRDRETERQMNNVRGRKDGKTEKIKCTIVSASFR